MKSNKIIMVHDSKQQQNIPTSGFQSLHRFDVVSEGKDRYTEYCDHEGNRNFELLIRNNIPLWKSCQYGMEQQQEWIYDSIVASIQQDGGRFLEFRNEWNPNGNKNNNHNNNKGRNNNNTTKKTSTEDDETEQQSSSQTKNNITRWILKPMTQEGAKDLVRIALEKLASIRRSSFVSSSTSTPPHMGTTLPLLPLEDEDMMLPIPDVPLVTYTTTEEERDDRIPFEEDDDDEDMGDPLPYENIFDENNHHVDYSYGSFQKSETPSPVTESPFLPRPRLQWAFSPIEYQRRRPLPPSATVKNNNGDDNDNDDNNEELVVREMMEEQQEGDYDDKDDEEENVNPSVSAFHCERLVVEINNNPSHKSNDSTMPIEALPSSTWTPQGVMLTTTVKNNTGSIQSASRKPNNKKREMPHKEQPLKHLMSTKWTTTTTTMFGKNEKKKYVTKKTNRRNGGGGVRYPPLIPLRSNTNDENTDQLGF